MNEQDVLSIPMVRMVPKGAVTDDDLVTLAAEQNWLMARVIDGDEHVPAELIVCTQARQAFVHWIRDSKTGMVYFAVRGETQKARDDAVRIVRESFEMHSTKDLIDLAVDSAELHDRMRAIYSLALVAPTEIDEQIFEIFRLYTSDRDEQVRGAAILAMSYVGWPRFRELLMPLAENDPDAIIREDAATMLQNLTKYPARSIVAH